MPPSPQAILERDVGRISGTLDRVVDSLDETREEMRALHDSMHITTLQNSTILTELTSHIGTVDDKLTKVETQIADLMTTRNKRDGAFLVLFLLMGLFYQVPSALWDSIFTFFRLK